MLVTAEHGLLTAAMRGMVSTLAQGDPLSFEADVEHAFANRSDRLAAMS